MNNPERFDLLIAIESEFGKRADSFGILTLSEAERVFLLSCWAKGALDGNGFSYFFLGPCNPEEVVVAFEQMQLPQAATACRLALAEFPDGKLIEDKKQLRLWVEQQGEALNKKWNHICKPIWGISADIFDEALANYIRKNRHQFDLQIDISQL